MLSIERIYQTNKGKLELFPELEGIPVKKFIGERIAVLGKSGSGKSVTTAVLCEEFTRTGIIHVIFDTDGDYGTLAEWMPTKYSVFRVFKRKYSEAEEKTVKKDGKIVKDKDGKPQKEKIKKEWIDWDQSRFDAVVSRLLGETPSGAEMDRRSVLVDIKRYERDDRLEIIYQILRRMYAIVKKEEESRWKHREKEAVTVVIDEAHEKFPQSRAAHMALLLLGEEIAKKGRKEGLGMLIGSQRPAEVSKNVLAQCGMKFMHKVDEINDLETYSRYITLDFSSSLNHYLVSRRASRLRPGQCFWRYDTNDPMDRGVMQVQVRWRYSKHPSQTPGNEALVRW